MPIFEYKCKSCGEEFEKLVFGTPEIRCPKCESADVQKKFSLFGMSGVEKPFAGQSGSGCSSCGSSGSACSSCG
ncbi:MAG TPA: zinc ribbon domain-containing protein [Nitrospirae bacterium]|nr:zinc ribbon domain-containing protein [Nitrospirota bacterium]